MRNKPSILRSHLAKKAKKTTAIILSSIIFAGGAVLMPTEVFAHQEVIGDETAFSSLSHFENFFAENMITTEEFDIIGSNENEINPNLIAPTVRATETAANSNVALSRTESSFNPSVFSSSALAQNIIERETPTVTGIASDIDISGSIPQVRITGISTFQNDLNRIFDDQFFNFVSAHANTAISMNFSFQTFTSGQFVSIVVYMTAVSASVTSAVATTVIDTSSNSVISLNDFRPNAVQVVNNHIRDLISESPRTFIANFSGIDSGHNFYVDGDSLVIPFGSAELFPGERGISEIRLRISQIRTEVLDNSFYHTLPPSQYSTVMVQLREVAERFGMNLSFSFPISTVDITQDGRTITSVTVGQNSYTTIHGATRELETAPIHERGRVFVPLSFLEEILGIAADMDGGFITLSRYER
ncbi:MAG: copper amine oxidase N-terminal domain-containing protein [Defluviitaleaceae bacterium]|nr:copper amine oxidase N-terminal domain-containing protein [Defluviitaleaceae bacterium]